MSLIVDNHVYGYTFKIRCGCQQTLTIEFKRFKDFMQTFESEKNKHQITCNEPCEEMIMVDNETKKVIGSWPRF